MRTYGQFCPIARASELLAERWTPIIVRNLLTGCRTFTEIRQGAPGISTALLAQRLDTLVRHGVVATTKPVDVDRLPDRTVVVRFDLRDAPDRYWMILRRPHPELCTRGLGYVEDLVACTDSATLVDIHLTRITYAQAVRTGRLTLSGPPGLARAVVTWFRPSPFAPYLPQRT